MYLEAKFKNQLLDHQLKVGDVPTFHFLLTKKRKEACILGQNGDCLMQEDPKLYLYGAKCTNKCKIQERQSERPQP